MDANLPAFYMYKNLDPEDPEVCTIYFLSTIKLIVVMWTSKTVGTCSIAPRNWDHTMWKYTFYEHKICSCAINAIIYVYKHL